MPDETLDGVRALDFPTRAVRLVEPFGVGGGPDLLARALAHELAELWDQPVRVENHPGGGSTAAPAFVASARRDGCTLLVSTSAHAYSAAAVTDLPYDPLRDFIPVSSLTSQPYVLVTGSGGGTMTLLGLIDAARARPGTLTFATTGVGTGTHLAIEELNLAAGISVTHVPPDPDEAISDVVAKAVRGETDYVISPISIAGPFLRVGQLVALGVTTTRRSPLLPDVPTIDEAGVRGYEFPIWYGLWARAGTSSAIVEKLAADVASSLAARALRGHLIHDGAEPLSMTQPEFARFVVAESRRAERIMERAGYRSV